MTFDDVIKSLEKAPLKPAVQARSFDITEPLPRTKTPTFSEPERTPPIKRANQVENPRPIQSPFPSQDIFRQPVKKAPPPAAAEAPKVTVRRGAADSPQGRLVPTSTSLPSAALDLIVVTAFTMIFLAAMLTTTKIDFAGVLRGINGESWTRISLMILFLSIMQMYVVISRSFFGCTLGEWTFDIQLGKMKIRSMRFFR